MSDQPRLPARCPICGAPAWSFAGGFWHGLSGGAACILYLRMKKRRAKAMDELIGESDV